VSMATDPPRSTFHSIARVTSVARLLATFAEQSGHVHTDPHVCRPPYAALPVDPAPRSNTPPPSITDTRPHFATLGRLVIFDSSALRAHRSRLLASLFCPAAAAVFAWLPSAGRVGVAVLTGPAQGRRGELLAWSVLGC
jgi:hypothetical protein